MKSARQRAEGRGRRGEAIAAWYLRLKGWRIVARRVKTPRGEIDLVARRGQTVAFVEVKWRATARELDRAIDPWRLRRVIAAAQAATGCFTRANETIRIDVVLVAPGCWPRHIVNATLA